MPKYVLTDAQIRAAQPGKNGKPKPVHDGGGLYLIATSLTAKSWVYRYQLHGKNHSMGLGGYPNITLKRARELCDGFRSMKAERIDPLEVRGKAAIIRRKKLRTLRQIGDAFFLIKKGTLKGDGDAGMWWSPLDNHVMPKLGEKTLAQIGIDEIVNCFDSIWRTKYPTAKKAQARLFQIIRYGSADDDFDLTILEKAKAKLGAVKHVAVHHPAAAWKDMPAIYKELKGSVADQALRLYILMVPRVSNVTNAVWGEMDFRKDIWFIPGDKMKEEMPFRIPLAWQAKQVLQHMKPSADPAAFIFPSAAAWKKGVVSENTWNLAFKARKRDTTAHGIRSSFSDWCVETGICDDKMAVFCLDHQTRTKSDRAYLRGDRLEERRVIMDKWAEFVTGMTVDDLADVYETKAVAQHYRNGGSDADAKGSYADLALDRSE
ncbi:MAG: Integrase [Cypionkella sp.]|uniref:tyrosine-type recombinase/integrase n=1 Tax=Cypionkella sp. TaxID=2811411 RepID=UPI00262961C2|nr:integrase arm-type DNA-binding domain-containing protein [Cypionkella sp.]MDB5657464.1 Integrase [Cypionkella sp.]